jgi:hypothetical protein
MSLEKNPNLEGTSRDEIRQAVGSCQARMFPKKKTPCLEGTFSASPSPPRQHLTDTVLESSTSYSQQPGYLVALVNA